MTYTINNVKSFLLRTHIFTLNIDSKLDRELFQLELNLNLECI